MDGYITPIILQTELDEDIISVNLIDVPDNTEVCLNNSYLSSGVFCGSVVGEIGFKEDSDEYIGYKVVSFLNDYYYRIHLIPSVIDFGYIMSDVEETFIIWNAYFIAKNCSLITKANESEYSLSGLTAPFILSALEMTEYTVTAPTDGAPEFEATITFDFGVDDDYVIEYLSGIRIVLFGWCPKVPMTEYLEWLTDIITARDGSEQRISVRRTPRQGYQITVRFETEQEQAAYEALMFKSQKRAWGFPIWTEWVIHTGTISAGASTITVDTTNADFRDDSLGIIWKSPTDYEIIKIATVAAGSLALSTVMQGTFTGEKYIMPLRITQMNQAVKRKITPDGDAEASVNFVVKDNALLTSYVAATTYKGLTVITKAAYVDGSLDETSDADIIISDYDTGEFLLYSDSDYNKITQSHLFKNFTKAECWAHREFIHSLLGQQGTVWIPSFKDDMILTDAIGVADMSFRIENIGLADNMELNALRTDVAFVYPDGSMILREITGITESGDEEIISIDLALGVEINPGDVQICFLDRYRLVSDKVKFEWETMGRNENQVDFLRVRE